MRPRASTRIASIGDQHAFYRTFEGPGEAYFWFRGHYAIAQKLAQQFWSKHPPGSRLLDVGAGPGNFLDCLARYGRVFASDLVTDAVRRCRDHHGIPAVCADATALPFRSQSMAAVSALEVVEHIPDDAGALAEIARVLCPGGWLLMSVPAFKVLWGEHDELAGHQRRYTKPEVVRLVRDAGFDIIYVTYARLLFALPLWIMRRMKRFTRRNGAVPRPDFLPVSRSVDELLYRLSIADLPLLGHASVPFGTHIFCVARRAQ